jgi:hypothetical protein
MIRKIEKFAHDLKVEYGIRADRALSTLREATIDTAELIKSSKSPIRKFADTGLKLNRITSRSVDRLVRNQVHLVEGTLDDGARRLKMAARANTVRDLIGDQIASLPASRDRTIGSARKTIDIFKLTGTDLRGVVTEVIGDIRDSAPVTVVRKTASSVDKRTRKAVSSVERKTRKAASDLEAKTLKTIADAEGKVRKIAARAERKTREAVDVVEKETRSVARKAAAKKRKPARKAVRKSTVRSAVAKTSAKTRTKVASKKAVAVKAVRKTASKRKVVARKVAQKTPSVKKAA